MMVVVVGGHRVRGARPAPHHRPVRQARGRPAHVRRPVHPPAPAREHQRRHPRDLRLLDHRLPADHRLLLPGQQPLDADGLRAAAAGACRSTTCSTSPSSSSSATSTPRSSSTPTTWRRTCASTAASSPASAPASAPPSTSTTSWAASPSGAPSTWPLIALLPEFLITGFKVAPIPVIGPGLDTFLTEEQPGLDHGGPGPQLLLRRHLAADHRGRGHGHRGPGRGAAHHAPLRRLHRQGRPEDPWPALGRAPGRRRACASSSWALRARGRARRPRAWPRICASPASRPATCCATPSPRARRSGSRPARSWRRAGWCPTTC